MGASKLAKNKGKVRNSARLTIRHFVCK